MQKPFREVEPAAAFWIQGLLGTKLPPERFPILLEKGWNAILTEPWALAQIGEDTLVEVPDP